MDSDSEATITLGPIAASGGAVGYVLSDAGGDNDGFYKVVSTPEGKQFWILLKDDDLVDDEDESELTRVGKNTMHPPTSLPKFDCSINVVLFPNLKYVSVAVLFKLSLLIAYISLISARFPLRRKRQVLQEPSLIVG